MKRYRRRTGRNLANLAKSLTHVSHSKSSHPPSPIGRRSRGGEPTDPKISTTRNLEPALGRDGFDVLGSWLATVPAKELRLKAWERTKTRVSLAGQIHCGYLTQLHVGAGPVRARPYTRTGLTVPQLTIEYTQPARILESIKAS